MRDTLVQAWLFAELMPDEVDALYACARPLRLAPGAVLVEAGRRNEAIWIVCEGKVSVLARQADGTRTTVAELGAGEMFGEMSWLDGQPASATTLVTEAAHVLKLTFVDFDRFLTERRDAHLQILRKLAINLSHRLRTRK
jgi:CRP/FNR family cyclic AMP-dependent transcriptional regulator